ncbi:hypothetical protein PG997_003801 [Apiospora hydei]|uniref:Uncharacterized protein n=1 Tax=Apiospora hydei TaxID=1337664 RepID=A0ABR1X0E9_9PEZI
MVQAKGNRASVLLGALPPGDVTDYVTRPLPRIPPPRPSSASSSDYESASVSSRDASPAPSGTGTVPDVEYSMMVEECGGTPEGFAQKHHTNPDQKTASMKKDLPLTIKTEYADYNDYDVVSPVSPATPTQSYNPRRGNYDHTATNRAYGANDARRTQPPHSYQVPSSLRVPRPPPNNKPAHRRSDPGSPSIKEPSISGDAAQGTWQQNSPLRLGQIGAPVHRARSHDEQRVTHYGSEVPAPPSNPGSQSGLVGTYSPEQSRPPTTKGKKISFAGPRVNSYLNRARVSKQMPPPPPPPLKLADNSSNNNRTTEGHIKTPFPASSFDTDESDDEVEKKGRKFPSLSAFVGQSHGQSKSKAEGYRGLGGLVSRVTHRFSTEDPKRDKRGTTAAEQDRYLQAAQAVQQPPPGDEHNWI